MRSRTVCCTQ